MGDAKLQTKVLITRPYSQSAKLTELLQQAGAKVISLPTLEITNYSSDELLNTIQQLNSYEIIIFTSVNAVLHSAPLIQQAWHTIPSAVRFAAIGAATKSAIEHQGWKCSIYPKTNYTSEDLLALAAFQTLNNKAILILTGKDGRDHLAKTLISRGALVKIANCYERKMPKYADSVIIAATKNNFDFIVCTSNQSLENLAKILGEALLKRFNNTQLIAFSARLDNLAKSLGFTKKPIIAIPASDEGIVAAIIKNKGTLQ